MKQVNMLEAKSTLSALVKLLEDGLEDRIAIARNGHPVAMLVRYEDDSPAQRIGVAKGVPITAEGWDLDDADAEIAELFGVA